MTLTINRVLVYTVRLALIVLTASWLVGCNSESIQCPDNGDCNYTPPEAEDMKNLIASQISNMVRTTAAGSRLTDLPQGNSIPNLQQTNLEPGEYTLQFEAYPPNDGFGFSAFAIVNWKTRGQTVTRKVSIFSGAAITGVCDAVDVQIVDDSDINSGALAPLPYKVGASLSRGSRANIMQPATLFTNPRAVSIAAGLATTFFVPQGAGVVSAMVLVAGELGQEGTNSLAVKAYGNDNALAVNTQGWYPILQNPGWVPLTPRTNIIIVQNGDTIPINAQVVWGVEG